MALQRDPVRLEALGAWEDEVSFDVIAKRQACGVDRDVLPVIGLRVNAMVAYAPEYRPRAVAHAFGETKTLLVSSGDPLLGLKELG